MIRAFLSRHCSSTLALGASALLLTTGAPAQVEAAPPPVPGGKIGTLASGRYECELPGDAGGLIGERVPEYDFTVVNASSYLAGGVRGSYLLTGTQVVMTGGTLKGQRFERVSTGFLRQAGPEPRNGAMRCIRVTRGSGS